VRINVQLIDAEKRGHVWAKRFDANRGDLAGAQDEITVRSAQALSFELIEGVGRRIEHQRSADPDARDLVMRRQAFFNWPYSAETLRETRKAHERALVKDSIDRR